MVKELIKDGIFVIHALQGYEYHEQRIIDLFKKNNLCFEFVTDGDPIHFKKEILKKYFTPDIETKLSKGVISCTLNHIYAYEKIVQRQIKYAVVFENDPFFLGDFVSNLKRISDEIENLEKGFIISLENTTLRFPSFWVTQKGRFLYPAKVGRMAQGC